MTEPFATIEFPERFGARVAAHVAGCLALSRKFPRRGGNGNRLRVEKGLLSRVEEIAVTW